MKDILIILVTSLAFGLTADSYAERNDGKISTAITAIIFYMNAIGFGVWFLIELFKLIASV